MNENTITTQYKDTIKSVQRMLNHKFFAIDELTREDIASAAIAYAYMYLDSKGKDFDVKDWTSLSCWKASRLALSEVRRQKRELVSLTLDNPFVNAAGEEPDEAPAMVHGSAQAYSASKFDRGWQQSCRQVRKAMVRFLKNEVSRRNARIFWSRVMDRLPSDVVCKRFGITADGLYVIVHRVNDRWNDFGKGYFYACADAA